MNFVRNALSEIQLKYKISRAISEATNNSKLHVRAGDADDVISLAADHPQYVLQGIYDRLMYDGYVSSTTFLSIELLEQVVNNSSYTFHCVLADYGHLRNRLVELACIGGDNATCRAVKGAARRLVLEFSRMFADDDRLALLSRLADRVELQSGRKLLRSILLEKKRVYIRSPREGDIVPISPIERPEGASPRLPPSPIWTCQPCGFVNKSKHLRCIVCGSMKPRPVAKMPMPPPTATPAKQPAAQPPKHVDAVVPTAPSENTPTVVTPTQVTPLAKNGAATASSPSAVVLGSVVDVSTHPTKEDSYVVVDASPVAQPSSSSEAASAVSTSSTPSFVNVSNNSKSDDALPQGEAENQKLDSGAESDGVDAVANELPALKPTEEGIVETDLAAPGGMTTEETQLKSPLEAIDEEDAEAAAIIERARSQSTEPLQNSQYTDNHGVHHLVEAEDAEVIKAVLHHNAEVEEARLRRSSSLDASVASSSSVGKDVATVDDSEAAVDTVVVEEEPEAADPLKTDKVVAGDEETTSAEVVEEEAGADGSRTEETVAANPNTESLNENSSDVKADNTEHAEVGGDEDKEEADNILDGESAPAESEQSPKPSPKAGKKNKKGGRK